MNSASSQPCVRAKILSKLKLSPKASKDLGISSSNFKGSKACEMSRKGSKLDECDPLLIALARSINTSTSHKYACQRSTKVPIRVPAGFPMNHNFSQRLICNFEDVKEETEECAEEDNLALGFEVRRNPEVMKRSQSAILGSLSQTSANEKDALDCPSSTPITQSNRDKHSKKLISSVVRSLSSSFNTPSRSQTVGSLRKSYLTTPSLTLSSRRKSDDPSKTVTPTTGMIPRLSSRIKQVTCLIKSGNQHEDEILSPFDITAPVRRLKHHTFVFREL
ncbi:hypothetical protein DFH28DRAFT_369807 [Melampsora americana]|nr:hypothetical protein DFH28DRAFT_369807 [Melampsora americana]